MDTKLQLVPDDHDEPQSAAEGDDHAATIPFVVLPRRARRMGREQTPQSGRRAGGNSRSFEALARDERGAVTAEYAIVIMAAVAFAGLLVAILRSAEIRAMLVQLVEDALGAAG